MISRIRSSPTFHNSSSMNTSTDSNDHDRTHPRAVDNINTGRSKLLRVFYYIFAVCVSLYLILIMLSPSPLKEHKSSPAASYEQLTIVMNTFRRNEMMNSAVDYYSKCHLVKYIYVIWSDMENEPDPKDVERFSKKAHPEVGFIKHTKDSLNNRFKPLEVPHFDAIFSVDDDMRIPCDDLNLAYEVWRGSPRSLVGFMPRIHLRQQNGQLVYRCWWRVWWHGLYSIILTKAAIMHHDFFSLYTYNMPASVRELVDHKRNCEDIAMQFLIANVTTLPPIYVKGHLEDKGATNGISTHKNVVSAGHMGARSECLNELEAIFHGLPLVSSHIIVDAASNGWTNVPSTVWEYFSSDLWKF